MTTYDWTVTARGYGKTDAAIVADVLAAAIRDERNDPDEPVTVTYEPSSAPLPRPADGRGDAPAVTADAGSGPETAPETPPEPLSATERRILADALREYAAGVEESLDDDRDANAELGAYPVVEDYLFDADRILAGIPPAHDLTLETLLDPTGPAALAESPETILALARRLRAAQTLR